MTAAGKRRILFVNHTGRISGAEKVLLTMLRGLDRSRYEAHVLCPADEDLQRTLANDCVPFSTIPALQARFTLKPNLLVRYLFSFVGLIFAMRKQVKLVDPDLIHANTVRAGIAATIATAGMRRIVIWHVHDSLPDHPLSTFIRSLAYLSRATRAIAVSADTARAFRGRLDFGNRIEVIHNGVDLPSFPMKRPGVAPLKTELGLSGDSFLVCAVGQICARKGLYELLQAFAEMHMLAPGMHLAIAGKAVFDHEQDYYRKLISFTNESGISERVHFLGERKDVAAVLQSADLMVLNSREEPFGLVLVEAMSCGTPVLATRVGGIPEIVSDGYSGWLLEPGDTSGLASRLLELSQQRDLLARVAQIAHHTVCPRFSVDRFLHRVSAFYEQTAARADAGTYPAARGTMVKAQDERGV